MFVDKPQFKRWVSVAAVFGFVTFVLYLFFFGNLSDIVGIMAKTNIPIYIAAFAAVLGSATFNALTWHQILDKLSVKASFRRIFSLSWVGTFVDMIIPGGWSGDMFKTYLLSKDDGIDGAKAAASIVVRKVFELFVTLGALVTGLVLLAFNYTLSSQVITVIAITMVLLSLPLVLILYLSSSVTTSQTVVRLIRKIFALVKGKNANSADAENKLQHSLNEFHDGIMMLKTNPKAMLKPMVFQTIAWAFDILTLFIIFASIGYIVGPDKIIITNSIVINLQTQGVALAGIAQVVSSTLYSVLGITPLISIASSLLSVFPTFWFKMVIAFVAFQVIVFDRAIPFLARKAAKSARPVTLKPIIRQELALLSEKT